MKIAVVSASGIVLEILNFHGDVITDAQSVSGEAGVTLQLPGGPGVTFRSGFRYDAVAGTRFVVSNEAGVGWLCSEDDTLVSPPIVLSDLKSARIVALSGDCALAIVSGFSSSALDDAHVYPSDATAQLNLMGSVTDSLLPDLPADWTTPFWCSGPDGVWRWQLHTATQIRRVGRDGKAHVVACQTQLATLNEQVEAAETVAEVSAITWPLIVGDAA